jgi:hypothetical protein
LVAVKGGILPPGMAHELQSLLKYAKKPSSSSSRYRCKIEGEEENEDELVRRDFSLSLRLRLTSVSRAPPGVRFFRRAGKPGSTAGKDA